MSIFDSIFYKLEPVGETGREWTDGRIVFSVPEGYVCRQVDNPKDDMTISIDITHPGRKGRARMTGYYNNDARRLMKWRLIRKILWKYQHLPMCEQAYNGLPTEILDDRVDEGDAIRTFYRRTLVKAADAPLVTETSLIFDTVTSDYCDVRSYTTDPEPMKPVEHIIRSIKFLEA